MTSAEKNNGGQTTMKKTIIILILFLIMPLAAQAERMEWNAKKVSALTASTLFLYADYRQTSKICAWERRWRDTQEFYRYAPLDARIRMLYKTHGESNSWLGHKAKQHKVNQYFISIEALLIGATWFLDDMPALAINGGVVSVQYDHVRRNIKAGWGLQF